MNRAGPRDTGKEDAPDGMERVISRVESTRDDFWGSRCEVDVPYDGGSDVMKVFRESEQFHLAMDRAWRALAENGVDAEPVSGKGLQGVPDSPVEDDGSLIDRSETVLQVETETSAGEGDKERWGCNGPDALRVSGRAELSTTLGEKIREVGRRILLHREESESGERGDCNKRWSTPQKSGNDSALDSIMEGGEHLMYGECQRNLAAEKGTIAFDGCGEFLAAGETGSPDAFKCAACSCHRNFHRRLFEGHSEAEYLVKRQEATESEDSNLLLTVKRVANDVKAAINQVLPLLAVDLQKKGKERELFPSERITIIKKCIEVLEHNAKLMLATTECLSFLQNTTWTSGVASHDLGREKTLQGLPALVAPGDASSAVKEGKFTSQALIPVRLTGNSIHQRSTLLEEPPTNIHVQNKEHNEQRRKRKRTKFTSAQLEKLYSFAERVKWTLSGLTKEDIESTCLDIGIEPITLRYWLHNSKQKSRKKIYEEDGSCSRSPEHN
ncbi:hypothetical protein O6H91_16G033300 [Diphasiastrum complanatum]|uniref:Uncharacterized protein n=2 Tax=Diphasiastrum complanatum TaxID=34168 RepID=A0ACC2BB85_DIPCM|nr:hypothetical protein O6H91_Y159000 [Diphasiastrum complanatum]KAJ7527036.1 hypothetical protein O6H91_16G033300 [Diphasiastrum complanatum]KAJ7527037.1 hypothetical protein O6H91_16G033300 [Diphasiastrum complanatum]